MNSGLKLPSFEFVHEHGFGTLSRMAPSVAQVDGCSLLSATLMPSHITAAAPCWAISLSLAHKCISHRSPILHNLHFAGALLGRNEPPSQQCGHQVSEALCHQSECPRLRGRGMPYFVELDPLQ